MSPERIRPGSAGEPPAREPDQPAGEELELDAAPTEAGTASPVATAAALVAEPDGVGNADQPRQLAAAGAVSKPHGLLRRLYFGETRFDFVRRKRWWFSLSLVIIAAGAISLGTRGLNLDIEFVGGTAWTVQTSTVTVNQARAVLGPLGFGGATITQLGSPPKTLEVEAKLPKGQGPSATTADADKVAAALAKLAHVSEQSVSIETVGPAWGSQITDKAIEALIVFFLLVSAYISVFFEWRMALAAIITMLHDIAVTIGIYSLSGFDVTPDTVVAFLTILGYSLYDTIVVFDRVRDNSRNLANRDRMGFTDLVNLSMNQTLARSLNTSLVAILPILSVLIFGAEILGATTLEYFGLALIIGLTSGAYSSIFIASPLVAVMKESEPRYRQLSERLRSRGIGAVLISPSAVAAGALGTDAYLPRRAASAPASATRVEPTPTSSTVVGPAAGAGEVQSRPAARAPTRPAPARPPAKRRRKGGRR